MSSSWNIQASQKSKRAFNPIRSYVENDVAKVNQYLADNPLLTRPSNQINVSIGDPTLYKDFKPTQESIDSLDKTVETSAAKTDNAGDPEAREFLAQLYSNKSECNLDKSDVFITYGGSMALWLAINVLTDPGDNILFPNPGFPLAKSIAAKRGVEVREYKLLWNKSWNIDLEETQKLVDDRTKMILVNNPSNPLGAVWSESHVREILDFAEFNGLPIVSDEIYENIIFPGEQNYSFGDLTTNVPVIKCSGLAKEYYAPGWRIGWLALIGPEGAFKQIKKGLQNLVSMISHPNTVCMQALKDIYEKNVQNNSERNQKLQDRFNFFKSELRTIKGIDVSSTKGAMYAAINLKFDFFKDLDNEKQFALSLHREENVFVMPGSCFGNMQNFVRVVICCDERVLGEFASRLKRFCQKYYKQIE